MLRLIGSNIWDTIRQGLVSGRKVNIIRRNNGTTIQTKRRIKSKNQLEFVEFDKQGGSHVQTPSSQSEEVSTHIL